MAKDIDWNPSGLCEMIEPFSTSTAPLSWNNHLLLLKNV